MHKVYKYLKWLIALCIATSSGFLLLPVPRFDVPYANVLFSREDRLMAAHIAADEQWRFPVPDTVPVKFKTALLRYEDKRFERHPGVDPLALARAVYQNLRHGRVVSGASTLNMQVIRLARNNPARTYGEKLYEMLLALRLEWRYRKAEILRLYAGHAPFGGNVVGLEAAAWRYFGRQAAHLSWAEAAMLAVLPNSPALIHPGRGREKLQRKRDGLLKKLHADGHLSALDYQLAVAEPLPAAPHPLPRLAPHLLMTLMQAQAQNRFATTLDYRLQQAAAEEAARHAEHLLDQGIHNLAALIIDNRSFEVLAYIGNVPGRAQNAHGYALDLIRRPRSTGSTLKPFLFAHMIEQGELLPDMLVPDVPTRFPGFAPQNYDRQYRGAVPAREALSQSLNVPSVRLLMQHGVARFHAFLRNLGMDSLHRPPAAYGLSLILGGAEASLWQLGNMYMNLAAMAQAEGTYAHYRQAVVLLDEAASPPLEKGGQGGFSDENHENPPQPPFSKGGRTERHNELSTASAWLTLEALLAVARPGLDSHWRAFDHSRKIAWKTGTSYGLRDAWAVGVTPRYTVAVWTGNAEGQGVPELVGSQAAAPLLFALFNRLPAESGWFVRPHAHLRAVGLCRRDGYLSNGRCETVTRAAPRHSTFDKITPHHLRIHLDPRHNLRVHGDCESVSRMRHVDRFVLPPLQGFYYRRHHADYQPLPPYRDDCLTGDDPIALIYPTPEARLYLPVDLNGRRERVVFQAAHRLPDNVLYWHLDGEFIGTTRTFHRQAPPLRPGRHQLTLVDAQGNRLQRRFEVLEK